MKTGDVVLVKFPFTHLAATKKRPALVLSFSDISAKVGVVTVAMITSQLEQLKFPGDVRLESWKEAGLLHPSILRMAKVATLDREIIERGLGHISRADMKEAQKAFQKIYRDWI